MGKDETLTAGEVRELGEATWLLAQEYAQKNGLTVTKNGKTGHLVSVKGGVSKFIREAAREIDLSAYVKGNKSTQKDQRARVREFLKSRFNVVAISRGDGPYVWRIFVSDEWSKNGTVTTTHVVSKAISRDVDRLSEGDSGPVTKTSLWDDFEHQPVSEQQALILKWLYENGGKYAKDGFMLTRVVPGYDSDTGSISGSFTAIMDRGLVKRQMKNPRRWAVAALTQRGWWAAENLEYIQRTHFAIERFLIKTGGVFEGSRPKLTTTELGEHIHRNSSNVGRAISEMEERGYIRTEKSDGDMYYTKVIWIGQDLPSLGVSLNKRHPAGTGIVGTDAPVAAVVSAGDRQPVQHPAPVTTAPVITKEVVDEVINQLLEAAQGRVDQDELDIKTTALTVIHRMCKDVEAGQMSALRAVVEIEEAARGVL